MNYKVKVNNEAESKEVQELFEQLGLVNKDWSNMDFPKLISNHVTGEYSDYQITDFIVNQYKELTIKQLKDLVVLKRNSIDDATHIRGDGKKYFHAKSTDYFYQFSDDNEWLLSTWMNYQLLPQLKPIEKEEMKEYLVPQSNEKYDLDYISRVSASDEPNASTHGLSKWFTQEQQARFADGAKKVAESLAKLSKDKKSLNNTYAEIERVRTAEQINKASMHHIIERGKTYDSETGERSAHKTALAFNTITGHNLNESEVFLLLQILKDVRQWSKAEYHQDSAEDSISYAVLKSEALERNK